MAAFSSVELDTQAERVKTATDTIKSNAKSAEDGAKTMAELIREAKDPSATQLAADWDSLADSFKACAKTIDDCGDRMKSALKKYANETEDNEKQAADAAKGASEELQSLQQYF